MVLESVHVAVSIDRPADEVYDYASNPTNLPQWAAGLAGAGNVEKVAAGWVADSPMGRIVIHFTERNEYGILDHEVTLPSGERVANPMRVIANMDGCDVIFSVRRRIGMGEAEFHRDVRAVSADLTSLKRILEVI